MSTETPAKYQADPRPYEDKATLYRLYWGELLCVREIADRYDVAHSMITSQLEAHGIPRRVAGYTRDNSISPFSGFYSNAASRTDQQSRTVYDEDYDNGRDDSGEFEWSFEDYQRGER